MGPPPTEAEKESWPPGRMVKNRHRAHGLASSWARTSRNMSNWALFTLVNGESGPGSWTCSPTPTSANWALRVSAAFASSRRRVISPALPVLMMTSPNCSGSASRPATLSVYWNVCPDGAGGECFFQKNHRGALGGSVDRVALSKKRGEQASYIAIHDVAGLLELVQMNVLEFHPWGSTIEHLEHPDTLVFDLDPGPGLGWKDILAAARDLRERLGEVGLEAFARLSGGKGVHVVVPIAPVHDWDTAKGFCETVARTMATIAPDRYVASASKELRKGKLFIDWLRNSRGATSVASWSLRARSTAGVAMPLHWDELGRTRSGADYTMARALRRATSLRPKRRATVHRPLAHPRPSRMVRRSWTSRCGCRRASSTSSIASRSWGIRPPATTSSAASCGSSRRSRTCRRSRGFGARRSPATSAARRTRAHAAAGPAR